MRRNCCLSDIGMAAAIVMLGIKRIQKEQAAMELG